MFGFCVIDWRLVTTNKCKPLVEECDRQQEPGPPAWGVMTLREIEKKLDGFCKELFSYKTMLAYLLYSCSPFCQDLSLEEVEACIDADPKTGKVKSLRQEAGHAVCDLLFELHLPRNRGTLLHMLNVEAQSREPKYPLIKRGYYYDSSITASRPLPKDASGHPDYGAVRSVESTWIVLEPKAKDQATIRSFPRREVVIQGEGHEDPRAYETDAIDLIRLGGKGKPGYHGLAEALDVLINRRDAGWDERVAHAEEIMHRKLPFLYNQEWKEMFSYSAYMKDVGYREGLAKIIKRVMKAKGLDEEHAMDELLVPQDEREDLLDRLHQK